MNTDAHDSYSNWYVLHTHAKQEDRAVSNLNAWNVQTFNPKIKEKRVNGYYGAVSQIIKPLFPRYIFARFDSEKLFHKVSYTRGVHSIVCFGGVPARVDSSIIDILKSQMDKDGFVNFDEDFKAGDAVVIKSGPLKNFAGIFEREVKEKERVMILLTTVSYQSRVLIEKESIMKATL